MDKMFAAFGKIIIVLVIVAILVGGGIYLGQKFGKFNSPNITNSPSNQNTTQTSPVETLSPSIPSPTPQSYQNSQNIQAGGFGSYGKYSISVPTTWNVEKTKNDFQDLLTVSRGNYQLQINQISAGASPCVYPGESQTPMSQEFTSYITLGTNADLNLYRRGKSKIPYPNGEDQYVVCQKLSGGIYDTNTSFGMIYYMAPKNPDESILSQMDSIFQSIKNH